MFIAFAADSSSPLSTFGINLKSLIFQLITFVILVWLLNKYAVKKFMVVMDERKKELEKGLSNADEAKKALEDAAKKADQTLAEAREQADAILSEAHGEAAQLLKDVEDKAATKAERIVKEARQQLGRDVEKARLELKDETTRLVAKAAGIVLNEKIDEKRDENLIERALKGGKL